MISVFGIPAERIETYTFASLVPFTKNFVERHPELKDANVYNFIHVQDIAPDVGPEFDITPGAELKETAMQAIFNSLTHKGGETFFGTNIGTNIYMESEIEPWEVGRLPEAHAMETYLRLLEHFDPDNAEMLSIEEDKKLQERTEKLMNG